MTTNTVMNKIKISNVKCENKQNKYLFSLKYHQKYQKSIEFKDKQKDMMVKMSW